MQAHGSCAAVVLAAGKGTRMNRPEPKVLVPLCGKPMIHFVLETLEELGVGRTVVVVGYRAQEVQRALRGWSQVEFALQQPQLGTGHAVAVCRPLLENHPGPILVLTGDSPLVQADSLAQLLQAQQEHQAACVLGTALKEDPTGFGRIVRNSQGEFEAIVEQRDATEEELKIREVNLSCYVFYPQLLWKALEHIQPKNRQGEYYLTDCPGLLKRWGHRVLALPVHKPVESISINTPEELRAAEAVLAHRSSCSSDAKAP